MGSSFNFMIWKVIDYIRRIFSLRRKKCVPPEILSAEPTEEKIKTLKSKKEIFREVCEESEEEIKAITEEVVRFRRDQKFIDHLNSCEWCFLYYRSFLRLNLSRGKYNGFYLNHNTVCKNVMVLVGQLRKQIMIFDEVKTGQR